MKSDRERSFVAVEDDPGAVVGICGFCPDKYDTPNVVWGSWFYVAQEHRGRGIGRMLLRHTLCAVQKLGVAKLYLDTSNEPKYARAVAMYERYGFKTEGVLVNYYGPGSHFVIMGRDMAGAETG
jgi:ribosomal protein S18 acetylase RimI-like enzyme